MIIFCREVVHLGDLDLNPNVSDDADPINIPIARVITHERYNAREYTTDIALLKLSQTVRFNGKFYSYINFLYYPPLPQDPVQF